MRDNIVIEMEERDIEDLFEVLNESFSKYENFDKFKQSYCLCKEDRNTTILGYYKKDQMVGTLLYNIVVMPNGKEMTIWNVAVREAERKQGIATKLMEKAEEIAKQDEDISRMWLFSGKHRTTAHELYRKLGYDEERDKAFIKWVHKEG